MQIKSRPLWVFSDGYFALQRAVVRFDWSRTLIQQSFQAFGHGHLHQYCFSLMQLFTCFVRKLLLITCVYLSSLKNVFLPTNGWRTNKILTGKKTTKLQHLFITLILFPLAPFCCPTRFWIHNLYSPMLYESHSQIMIITWIYYKNSTSLKSKCNKWIAQQHTTSILSTPLLWLDKRQVCFARNLQYSCICVISNKRSVINKL